MLLAFIELLLGCIVLFLGLLLGVQLLLLLVQFVRVQLVLLLVKLILLQLFLLLPPLLLRGVGIVIIGIGIGIGWCDVAAIPGEVLQRLERGRDVRSGGSGAGGPGGPGGAGGGIGASGTESCVDADATAISPVPGGKTSTNARKPTTAATPTTACTCRTRMRLLARTAVFTSRTLVPPAAPVSMTHGPAAS